MIKAIFFATFDVDEGPKLHHLLPEPLPGHSPLLDFKPLAPYLVPPPALCNTPITLLTSTNRQPGSRKAPPHRILSHPIHIASEYYPRNAFTFNFGLVLEAATEFSSYLPVVKKLATLFRGLEEQGRFLSRDLASSANKVSPIVYQHPHDIGIDSEEDVRGRYEREAGTSSEQTTNTDNVSRSQTRNINNAATPTRHNSSSKIYALSEILLEDLNNYGETQIPLDAANTLSLKLFPTYPSPPPLYAWQVPLAIVSLTTYLPENSPHPSSFASSSFSLSSSSGDLTMTRILPYIDGVNSVHRIAQLADADVKLVRKAIRHLLYYGCCILLDIFAFGAIYAPTSTIAAFVDGEDGIQEECAAYVALPLPFPAAGSRERAVGDAVAAALKGAERRQDETDEVDMARDSQASEQRTGRNDSFEHGDRVTSTTNTTTNTITGTQLSELYLSLRQGLTLKVWCLEHPDVLSILDIRRFITFGVIKGFLYRVHKYAILTSTSTSRSSAIGKISSKNAATRRARARKENTAVHAKPAAAAAAGETTTDNNNNNTADESSASASAPAPAPATLPTSSNATQTPIIAPNDIDKQHLDPYLDGAHCFDQICTELGISERQLLARLKARGGDVQIICR